MHAKKTRRRPWQCDLCRGPRPVLVDESLTSPAPLPRALQSNRRWSTSSSSASHRLGGTRSRSSELLGEVPKLERPCDTSADAPAGRTHSNVGGCHRRPPMFHLGNRRAGGRSHRSGEGGSWGSSIGRRGPRIRRGAVSRSVGSGEEGLSGQGEDHQTDQEDEGRASRRAPGEEGSDASGSAHEWTTLSERRRRSAFRRGAHSTNTLPARWLELSFPDHRMQNDCVH